MPLNGVLYMQNLEDITSFFFEEIKSKGKYEIDIEGNSALIIPREEERYYKPNMRIPDLSRFSILLMEYIDAVNEFNERNDAELKKYQNISYIFNIMLFNLASSDGEDLNRFLETRIQFLKDRNLDEYSEPTTVYEHEDVTIYAERKVEEFGLETPYIMVFTMTSKGKTYNLPLIRYAVDANGVCYIYAIQMGRHRSCDTYDPDYKSIVNGVNQGLKEFRNVSPSFTLTFAIFLRMLVENDIKKIVIPDFLFNRYRKYYRANTEVKSSEILSRMLKSITVLVKRMDVQVEGFNIRSYPLDVDSYFHIDITTLSSKNKVLKDVLNANNNSK